MDIDMVYMGSKRKIAKFLLPILLERRNQMQWVEPFVGGANMIDKVDGIRVGSDSNFYLIELLKSIRDGWVPPTEVSENKYNEIKNNKEKYPPDLVGFVGFCASFGAKWYGGYARSQGRNIAGEGCRNLLKQAPNLRGINFINCDYKDLSISRRSIIYCDPPYFGTTKYKDNIDHDHFWQWCRDQSSHGHVVYISEYSAPSDFINEIMVESNVYINRQGIDKSTEKLFRAP